MSCKARCEKLSDFDCMRDVRLPNWGAWGRQDDTRPDPEAGSGAIYGMGKSAPGGDVWTFYKCFGCKQDHPDPGKCKNCGMALHEVQERIEGEPPPPPVDAVDAEWLSILIRDKIGAEHRRALRLHFYRKRAVSRERVDDAIRALLDVEYVATELGWGRAA